MNVTWNFRGDWIAQFYRLPEGRLPDHPGPIFSKPVLTVRERSEYQELLRLDRADCGPARFAGIVSCGASHEDISSLLKARFPPATSIRFVALLQRFDRWLIRTLYGAGVRSFLTRSAGEEEILNAVRNTRTAGTYFSDELMRELIDDRAFDPRQRKHFSLTSREVEVLTLLARGESNKVVARALDLSVRTVESHRLNIRRKIGASTTEAFAAIASAIMMDESPN